MKRKHFYIIGGIVLFVFFFYKLGSAFAPGSYPYSEQYELNYPEKKK
jgi:hypothetical protein